MKNKFPQSVALCLWSYDLDRIDLSVVDHRTRVVLNVLNYGTKDAIDWLRSNFSKEEITHVIRDSYASEWNKKSLSLWSLIFQSYPIHDHRFA